MGRGGPALGRDRFPGDGLSSNDFSTAATFLHAAFDNTLGPNAKKRLEHLALAHTHARLISAALRHPIRKCSTFSELDVAIYASRRLADFRREFHADLRCCLPCLILGELRAGDTVGVLWHRLFTDSTAVLHLPVQWHFRVDPDGRGTAENWQRLPWKTLENWPVVPTDRPWDSIRVPPPFPGAGNLATYDGTGWYSTDFDISSSWKGHKVYLVFGPSDDARQVAVNGKVVPRPKAAHPGFPVPFRVRIDPFFTMRTLHQVVVVRVTDSGGAGGLRNPVWVCVDKQPENGKKATKTDEK